MSSATSAGRRGPSSSCSAIDEGDHQQQHLSISLDRLSLRDGGNEESKGDGADSNAEVQFVDYEDESQLSDVMGLVDGDLSEPYSIFTYRYFLHQWPELCTLAMLNGKAVGCVICKIDEEDVPVDDADAVLAGGGDDHEHGHDDAAAGEDLGGGEEGGGGDHEDEARPPDAESTSASASAPAGGTTTDDAGPQSESDATPVHTNSARATRKKRTGYMAMLAVSTKLRRSGIGTALVCRAVERIRNVAGCTSVVLETEVTNVAAMRLYERLGFMREELLVKYYLNWGDAYRLRLWLDDSDDSGAAGGGVKHDA